MESEPSAEQTLNMFFSDLYARKLSFSMDEREVHDIRNSVIEMVHNIADKLGNIDQRFKIAKVITVGSAAEGTQIVQPNEFDFHLIVEHLSQEDAIYISEDCDEMGGCVHITIKKCDISQQWVQMVSDGKLVSTNGGGFNNTSAKGLRQEFHKALQEAMNSLECKQINMRTGILSIANHAVTKHGPAFTPTLIWQPHDRKHSKKIFVDLCPVIRIPNELDKILKLEDVTCSIYHDYAEKVGSVNLMPCTRKMSCKNGLCFKATFTSAEILLVRDMSLHHRKCYKILKYILNGILARTATAFHSYALKTLTLNHHYKDLCTDESNTSKCVLTILKQIQAIVEDSPVSMMRYDMRKYLPSLFFKHLSVWNHEQSILDSDIKIRLSRLMTRLGRISRMKDYAFDKCYIRSVNCSNLNRVYIPIGFVLYEALDHIFERQ